MLITTKKAQSIKPGDKPFKTGTSGLSLHATKDRGVGNWILRYQSPVTSKRREMTLGKFPDISVADAMTLANSIKEGLRNGIDPLAERKQQQEEENASKNNIPTFKEVATQYHSDMESAVSKRHWENWIRSLELYVFDLIGDIKVNELKVDHFEEVLKPIWVDKYETASRVENRCRIIMDYCFAKKLTDHNPVNLVKYLLPKVKSNVENRPAMPWQDVPGFIKFQLFDVELLDGSRAALLFMILTAARSGEVRGATWTEIDFNKATWTLPAERMKANKEHSVPLSKQALRLLEVQHQITGWKSDNIIFPNRSGNKLSDASVSKFMRERDIPSMTKGVNAVPHGFRSTFRNWAADHEYDYDTAERALAHEIRDKVQAAYERTDRFDARKKMMQHWADHVTSALTTYFGLRINDIKNSTEELVVNENNSDRPKILVAKTEKIIEELGTNSKGVNTIKISTRRTFTEANKD